MFRKFLSIFAAIVCLGASQAQAETNILFIVDGSNSMWGQIDEKAKVETARETLAAFRRNWWLEFTGVLRQFTDVVIPRYCENLGFE